MALEFGELTEAEMLLVAKYAGTTLEKVREAQKVYLQTQTASLDSEIRPSSDDASETTLGDMIADPRPGPEELAIKDSQREHLLKIMEETLQPRELYVIKARFGFLDGNAKTLEEVGEMFSLTRERIRQIESKAIRKLRYKLGKYGGKDGFFMG